MNEFAPATNSTSPTSTPSAPTSATTRVRTPLWQRFTALISLGSLVVIIGITLAFAIGIGFLLTLLLLERAAG